MKPTPGDTPYARFKRLSPNVMHVPRSEVPKMPPAAKKRKCPR